VFAEIRSVTATKVRFEVCWNCWALAQNTVLYLLQQFSSKAGYKHIDVFELLLLVVFRMSRPCGFRGIVVQENQLERQLLKTSDILDVVSTNTSSLFEDVLIQSASAV
jgi:hypothetical protein